MSKVILFFCSVFLTYDTFYADDVIRNIIDIKSLKTKIDQLREEYDTNVNSSTLNVDTRLNSIVDDNIEEIIHSAGSDVIVSERFGLIFPGTKWCGPGNTAKSSDELGSQRETDACCRAHDQCNDTISARDTNHNLKNGAIYTRLHCDCDDQFRTCLKSAGTFTSKAVGIAYFVALHTKCFKEDYPITGCEEKGGSFNTQCVKYSFDTTVPKIYQWFDVAGF